jgi:AraC-like DNA-binding protein
LSLWLKSSNDDKDVPAWLSQLVTQINTGSFVSLRVDDVIATTNYSHSYVCKCFQKYYGKSLASYLNNAKFSYSKVLLADDNYSINQISDALNYTSPTNFTLAFKSKFGISPTEWKKQQLIK